MQSTTYDEVSRLARSGANVLHVASFEWERVRGWCIALTRDLEIPFPMLVWSASTGLLAVQEDGQCAVLEQALTDPIEAMMRLKEVEDGGVMLLEDIHPYLEPQHHVVVKWVRDMCRLPAQPRRLLILSTAHSGLAEDLQKEVPSVDLPLPGIDELAVVATEVAARHGVEYDGDSSLLEAARGLTVMEARLAYGHDADEHRALGAAAVPLVVGEKKRVIRQSQVLEYYEPDARLVDVGGLENLKEWLVRRGRAFGSGARDFGLEPPKGVLLLGVQGCGKSLFAKSIAASWQFPLLRFDLGKVFGGFVGQSESNIRGALAVAQALAPCVLWIDEIEKGLSGMGSSDRSDGGTTARVIGTLLTWMQERREPVFVVATANRIDMLPPELLRKGRFDDIFFVDLPTTAVRREILAIHLRKKQRDPAEFGLDDLSEMSQGFSGAELEEAVGEGLINAFADGVELRTEHVAKAPEDTFPLSRTMGEHIEQLRVWARIRARLASPEEPEPLPADLQDRCHVCHRRTATRSSRRVRREAALLQRSRGEHEGGAGAPAPDREHPPAVQRLSQAGGPDGDGAPVAVRAALAGRRRPAGARLDGRRPPALGPVARAGLADLRLARERRAGHAPPAHGR